MKVNIVLSTYNNEKTLSKTLRSIKDQIYDDWSLIAVNDASTDSTANILSSFQKESSNPVQILTNKSNIGLTKSLNKGLSLCDGIYIARIDSDDWWHTDKLMQQVRFLESNTDYSIVGSNYISHREDIKKSENIFMPGSDSEIRKTLLKETPFIHSSIVFKRSESLYYDETYETTQDYKLYAELLLRGKGMNIQNFLTERRTHRESSMSTKKWKVQVINSIRARKFVFENYDHTILSYRYFLSDFLKLSLPTESKHWVQKIKSNLSSN